MGCVPSVAFWPRGVEQEEAPVEEEALGAPWLGEPAPHGPGVPRRGREPVKLHLGR